MGIRYPKKSALQQTAAKLNKYFWNKILKLTCGNSYLVAIDSTGFSRTQASYHYLYRIDSKFPQVPVKLSVSIDTRKKKFCCAKIRVLPAHDSRDAEFLLKKSKAKIGVLDKAYNSEDLYEFAFYKKILLMIPKKVNVKKGFFRKKAEKLFNIRTYHRREIAESGNSSIKRKYGSSVSSKSIKTISTEIFARLVCHNLFFIFQDFLDTASTMKNLLNKEYVPGIMAKLNYMVTCWICRKRRR